MTINIKLQRYLIAFLESEFGQQPIAFPRRHLLNKTLYFLTAKPPRIWREEHYGDENCQVVIPFLSEKDPNSYFYISNRRMTYMADRVRDLFLCHFHGFILASHASGITSRAKIVDLFAEQHNLFHVTSVIDLLEKMYQRFMEAEKIRSKRNINFL